MVLAQGRESFASLRPAPSSRPAGVLWRDADEFIESLKENRDVYVFCSDSFVSERRRVSRTQRFPFHRLRQGRVRPASLDRNAGAFSGFANRSYDGWKMNKLAMTERWAVRLLMASGLPYKAAKSESPDQFRRLVMAAAIHPSEPRRRFARRFV